MYSALIENNGDSSYHASVRGYSFMMDTVGQGANPIDTLLAALCGCISHQLKDFVIGEGIEAKGFTVKAEADLSKDRRRLSDISVSIAIKGAKLDGRQEEEILEYVKRCSIHNTLRANSNIRIVLTDRQSIEQQPENYS
jgi:uncharacterized OsmC-like protein